MSLRRVFSFDWQEDREFVRWKKCVLGHPIARATSYCLLPDTLWLRGPKNAFKVGSVKFTVTAFHCEEGTHQNAGQKSKELTTPPESPNTWHLALFASTGTRRKQKRVRGLGGGLCMFVNKKWATNFTVRECISIRSYEIMTLLLSPHFLPREFGQVTVILVYVPHGCSTGLKSGALAAHWLSYF